VTRHRACGTALRWKSVLDDGNEPAMVPWCDQCKDAVGYFDMLGTPDDMPAPDTAELAEHVELRQLARTWAPSSPKVH